MPKVIGRGRPKGKGLNMDVLKRLRVGDSLWDVPYGKLLSFRSAAGKLGIRLKTRRIPETDKYAIQRIS